jgi:hypothetical protein
MSDLNKKQYLEKYFPALFLILEENQFGWKDIQKIHYKAANKRAIDKQLHDERNESFHPEAHFFDIVEMAQEGKAIAVNFLKLFTTLFETLSSNLDSEQKKNLRSTIGALLSTSNHEYLNYTGELLVLNQLLNKGEYKFLSKAFPLGNDNDADFHVLHIGTNKKMLVEVVNIHLEEVADNTEDIKKFLKHRINQKFEKKRNGHDDILRYTLVPVVWGSEIELRKLSEFYKHHSIDINDVTEVVAYCSFYFPDGKRGYHFGRVSGLFEITSPA